MIKVDRFLIDMVSRVQSQQGEEKAKAISRLQDANQLLVMSIATQYQNRGLTMAELIDKGNIGLVKAAEKFDESTGFHFLSYAVWWMRQTILQAIAGLDGTDNQGDVQGKAEPESQPELSTLELSDVLQEPELTIIRECFGIGCHEKGLEEIGDQLGLTRERVRQMREDTIAKLRESGHQRILMKHLM
jgi:RNA polymerase primary sigma factor